MLFKKNKIGEKHAITVIAEFLPEDISKDSIAYLSEYVSDIALDSATVSTDVQSFPAGYRVTYVIEYVSKRKNKEIYHYTKKLANLSPWLYSTTPISRFHYNFV